MKNFPDEATQNTNYVWSLLIEMDILTSEGNLLGAGNALEKLKQCQIKGSYFQSYYPTLQERFNEASGEFDKMLLGGKTFSFGAIHSPTESSSEMAGIAHSENTGQPPSSPRKLAVTAEKAREGGGWRLGYIVGSVCIVLLLLIGVWIQISKGRSQNEIAP